MSPGDLSQAEWRARCGTPWRDVPPKYGNGNSFYQRLRHQLFKRSQGSKTCEMTTSPLMRFPVTLTLKLPFTAR
ncbi:transposase [Sinorhizobium medicae]|nr:transposase [Sinorhizobium medicae]MQW41567.1 transposase [Sinorhizobium meliloti]